MSSFQKVIVCGNVGQDPESRSMPNGEPVCNLRIATSESWKDKQTGEKREATEWHGVVLFGKIAEIAAEYVRKGSKILIEGTLHTRKWQDKQGNDRYTTEIRGTTLKFLSPRQAATDAPRQSERAAPADSRGRPAPSDEFDDSIPF